MDSFSDEYEPPEPISIWRENHGNGLLALVAVIGIIGCLILAFGGDKATSDTSNDLLAAEAPLSIDEDDQAEAGTLVTITVRGASDDEGQMMLAIYDAANRFNDPNMAMLKSPRTIRDGQASWIVATDKLPGMFAIAAFHDQNADGMLNRNLFGIPTEPYGFSNQARGNFGPPSFEQAVLNRPEEDDLIEIFLGATIE